MGVPLYPPSTSYTVDSPYNKNRTLIAYFTPATWSVTLSQAAEGTPISL
ncbi:hypothetical protein LPW11_16290 [Geomonas sp. RF6]|nr:hypothetical protein [Geomonas sp. RF6]UFS69448.1 hypothetical protein LPW11_16290 [Geomonas sp. RF6]